LIASAKPVPKAVLLSIVNFQSSILEIAMSDIQILRFLTAGSVDDGKSTLIGRLLFDTRSLPGDTLEYLENPIHRLPDGTVNLALLTDGLRSEREQGITIDIAHKYFATAKRKFIISDAPGHVQYTRNMVTGASNADLVVILVDARHGVIEQTRRHSYLASLLGIRHLVVAVNKIDLVDWSEQRFNEIRTDYLQFAQRLGKSTISFIPLSALKGDNVVHRSEALSWYQGPTLLEILENSPVHEEVNWNDPRFPIQYVIRPQSPEYPDYRGYAGRVASGTFRVGDPVVAEPSGLTSHIKAIDGLQGPQTEAYAGQSVTLLLEDEIDIARGDLLTVAGQNAPALYENLSAQLCWMDQKAGRQGGRYLLRTSTRTTRVILASVESVLDIATLEDGDGDTDLKLNDIARVELRLAAALPADPYESNRKTGAFILIDEGTNQTAAAGVILGAGKKEAEYEV
jgi:sulfate adenylyltransferase subunit 1